MQQAQRIGAPRAIALCQCFIGAVEFQAGHWSQAEAALRQSIQLYHKLGAAAGEALACQHLGALQTAQGKLDQALTTLEDGVVAAKRALLRGHLLARLYAAITRNRLRAGDLPAADYALSSGLKLTQRHGHCTICESLLLPVAVHLRIAQDDLAAAEEFNRQLDAAATRYGSRTWLALACQAQAELAQAHGDIDAALQHYEEAYAGFQEAGNQVAALECLEAMTWLRQGCPVPDTTPVTA
jgi:predicted negative regulator of RcsB-dependent stress response